MKDPPRLLETTRSNLRRGNLGRGNLQTGNLRRGNRDCGSLERGLLRSAYSDRAPDAVRAHVLESVNRVLAEAAPRLPASSAAGKRGLLLRVVHAAYLGGGLLAAAAGVGVVMLQQSALQREGAGDIPQSSMAWLPGPTRPAPARVSGPPVAPQSRSKPPRLAALSPSELSPAEARAARLAQGNALASTHSEHLRSGPLSSSLGRGNPGLGTRLRADEGPEDWLGAQLRLLREARVQLQAGRLEQAERVLNSYGPRFPGGVLGPQVNGLREELSERRTTARAVSARGVPLR